MLNLNVIDLEKRSLFYINSALIVLMIFFIFYEIPTRYFFYLLITITFILSYVFFKHSKKLSKYLIITNMFIFFYFLYPIIGEFLYELLGEESYTFILFYNILIAYIFLLFSGHHKNLLKRIKEFKLSIFLIIILIGIIYGIFFYLVKEPVPIQSLFNPYLPGFFTKAAIFTLILAISEQAIFSGFLFNVYKQLTTTKESYFQVSTIFVLFHLLRFENLIVSYIHNFETTYLLIIIAYYIFLFLFMLTALHLYNFKSKKYSGNFIYPVILHFTTDFTLFILIKIIGGY